MFFWTKFAQKRVFLDIAIEFSILNFNLGTNFHLEQIRKNLLMVNNSHIPKFFIYHEIHLPKSFIDDKYYNTYLPEYFNISSLIDRTDKKLKVS